MTQQPNILEAAKQGNPQAIAALLSRNLQPKGIVVKVSSRPDGVLQILLESAQAPAAEEMVAFVQQGMAKLQPKGVRSLVIFGRSAGEEMPDWRQGIDLEQVSDEVQQPAQKEVQQLAIAAPPKVEPVKMATAKPASVISVEEQPLFQLIVVGGAAAFIVMTFGVFAILLVIVVPLAAGLIYWTFLTPQGQNYAAQFNRQAAQNEAARLERLRQTREDFQRDILLVEQSKNSGLESPEMQAALERLINAVEGVFFNTLGKPQKLSTLRLLLSVSPSSSRIWDISMRRLTQGIAMPGEAYAFALQVLEENPSQAKAKQLVLHVGRWYFGGQRKDKKVTIYDEQAIQNDIQVRSK